MSDSDTFLHRVIAARRAAWIVWLIALGIQMLTYLSFLAIEQGWADGLLDSGLYGDMTREDASRLAFLFAALLKLMNFGFFLGALFLTLWVRGLRRNSTAETA